MKKIVFGITSLTLGGAERVLVDLANKLSQKQEYQITIFTIYGQGELEKQLSSDVKLQSLYNVPYKELSTIKRKISVPLSILIQKRKIYKKHIENKYDVEIAFLEGPITRIFASRQEQNNKIAWVHNDIGQVFGTGIKAKLKRKIDEKIYERFKKIVFVSKSNMESFKNAYPKNNVEKQVIYNYINAKSILDKSEVQAETAFDKNSINLLVVARLVPQKALDRLVKVHADLIKEGIKHKIYIIGDGPEKQKLQELIKTENCENTVKLLGKKENPYPYMKEADYICLLSEFEGYGMVLEEAKILNKYILITDTAAKEAIKNYHNSKVFENSYQGIYQGLKDLLLNPSNENSNDNKQNKYDNSNIIEKVEKIIQ